MEEKQNVSLEATPEQILYAKLLEKGMYIGLLILLITFGLYAFGVMDPYIPLNKISKYWTMNVNDYLHHANIKAGWAWVGMLKYGDFVNFIGIAILAGGSLFVVEELRKLLFPRLFTLGKWQPLSKVTE